MQRWAQYSKRLSLSILSLILLTCIPLLALAQPTPASDEALATAINEIMTQAYKPNEPGASIIVTRNGKVVFQALRPGT